MPRPASRGTPLRARMVKLVYTGDLKSLYRIYNIHINQKVMTYNQKYVASM